MKKFVFMGLIILLLSIASIAAVYHLMYGSDPDESEESIIEVTTEEESASKPDSDEITEDEKNLFEDEELVEEEAKVADIYYVTAEKVNVMSRPTFDSYVTSSLYLGEEVEVFEELDGWVRITMYIVYEEGGEEEAWWVDSALLSKDGPVMTQAEHTEYLGKFISQSDDYAQHQDAFITAMTDLLMSGVCTYNDFETLGGWIRSIAYPNDEVYFVYCGGIRRNDKVYLNVTTEEIVN